MSWKIVFGGVGGQGIISAGIILAEAAVIHEGRYAVQSQKYGAEMRGGLSRADVTISNREVIYPKVDQAHLLVCLHRKALAAYTASIRPGGLLISDRDEAPIKQRLDSRQLALPIIAAAREATREERNANLCLLGAVVAVTGVVRIASIRAVVRERFGENPNLNAAIDAGLRLGEEYASVAAFQSDTQEAGRHALSARM